MNEDTRTDHVGRALAEWQAACPEFYLSASALTLRIVLLGRYIEQQARAGFTPFDSSPGNSMRWSPCGARGGISLGRGAGAQRAHDLQRLDRLQPRGLVQRAASPGDRRQVLVRLTPPAGRGLVGTAVQRRAKSARQLPGLFSANEVARLTGDLRRLLLALGQGEGCGEA